MLIQEEIWLILTLWLPPFSYLGKWLHRKGRKKPNDAKKLDLYFVCLLKKGGYVCKMWSVSKQSTNMTLHMCFQFENN